MIIAAAGGAAHLGGVLAAGTGRATPLVHRWTFNNGAEFPGARGGIAAAALLSFFLH